MPAAEKCWKAHMLSNCSPIGFIPITDSVRARKFYVDVLKLRFEAEDSFALVVRGHGISIRLAKMEEFVPAAYTIFGWEAPDLSAAVRELTGAGVSFLRVPRLEQDDLGIWTSPSGAQVAWFHDPDGNVLSLSQH